MMKKENLSQLIYPADIKDVDSLLVNWREKRDVLK